MRETLGADVAGEYARIVAAGGEPGASSLELARRNVAAGGSTDPAPVVRRPWWARLLAWLVDHWRLVVVLVLVLVVWAGSWVAANSALLVEIVGWGLVAAFLLAAFAVWTGGQRRGVRHPVLDGLLIASVAGWLAGRSPRRSRRRG